MNLKQITAHLSPDDWERIETTRRALDVSRSEVIRRAIAFGLDKLSEISTSAPSGRKLENG